MSVFQRKNWETIQKELNLDKVVFIPNVAVSRKSKKRVPALIAFLKWLSDKIIVKNKRYKCTLTLLKTPTTIVQLCFL